MIENEIHSFPSGDVTVAAGLAAGLFLLAGRGRVRYLVFGLAALSAAGRMLGAKHYPSDCLFGALVGIAVAALLWKALMPPREETSQAAPESVTTSS
jgi:membrane-associated phospholipid phosphatase